MTATLRRRLPAVVLLAAAVCVTAATGQAPPATAPAKQPEAKKLPPTDYQDFVFLASDRPVLIRVHMLIDGKPYYEKFDEYFKDLFAQIDRDKDGVLSKEEVEIAPHSQFLQQHLQGAIGIRQPGQKVTMNDMDTNKDGKVSVEEFTDYYRRNGFTALRFFVGSNAANTERINDAILKHLGAEKDGKLTQELVAKAPGIFMRLDTNEDEMITADELAPQPGRNRGGFVVFDGGGMRRPQPQPQDNGVIDIRPGQPLDGAAQRLLNHYDKDKNGKLSRAEIGIDKELFDRLDANKDDQLDKVELVKFFERDADLELVGRIGKITAKETMADSFLRDVGNKIGIANALPSRVEVFNPTNRPMPLASAAKKIDDKMLELKLGDATLEFQASDNGFNRFQGIRQFYLQQFQMLDADKRGFVEKKQLGQDQFLRELFELADRDGDGKMTEKELKDYLDLQAKGANCTTTLQGNDLGRSLFDLFDADRDGRLSVREMRTGWSRMQPFVKPAAEPAGAPATSGGALTKTDVPRRLTFALGQGQNVFFAGNRQANNRKGPAAPLWFTKMDRNNDGDISPSEFLGTEEEFRMLDADGDGLISAEEARQWEARQKKAKEAEKKEEEKKP
jgi:Ca2+-binding EF-hand superfamily protein